MDSTNAAHLRVGTNFMPYFWSFAITKHAKMLPTMPKMLNSIPSKDVKSSSIIPNGRIS